MTCKLCRGLKFYVEAAIPDHERPWPTSEFDNIPQLESDRMPCPHCVPRELIRPGMLLLHSPNILTNTYGRGSHYTRLLDPSQYCNPDSEGGKS